MNIHLTKLTLALLLIWSQCVPFLMLYPQVSTKGKALEDGLNAQ